MRIAPTLVFGSAPLAAVNNVAAQPVRCRGDLKARHVAELMFGRDIADKVGVSEAAWAQFVPTEMTPRFPDGLTITDAGQWRDRRQRHESCTSPEARQIVLPGHSDDTRRASTPSSPPTKRQFHQQLSD